VNQAPVWLWQIVGDVLSSAREPTTLIEGLDWMRMRARRVPGDIDALRAVALNATD
jgi:hypothetical protein